MYISCPVDGGNIDVLNAGDATDIRLAIRSDSQADFKQWFYFRMVGAEQQACTLHIENASETSYPAGWEGYRAVASYDREYWFRVDSTYDGKKLTIQHTPTENSVYYAYFAPYSQERHSDLVNWAQLSDMATLSVLGQTVDGQDLDYLTITAPGDASARKQCWVIARQHPGETMAEWWMEGFLTRLLDEQDAVARSLLQRAVFHVVPNMNPDGSRRGHLRSNAAGANLNREWAEPSLERSPEVLHVLHQMQQTGVDFCLDVHGDEALPYNFIAGAEGIPGWNEAREGELSNFLNAMVEANPDFQTRFGYDRDQPGQANLTVCTNAIAHRFGCLAMTLEMPFKDTADTPDEIQGWSPERCVRLGSSTLNAIHRTLDSLQRY